jgi:hypothetical protein
VRVSRYFALSCSLFSSFPISVSKRAKENAR